MTRIALLGIDNGAVNLALNVMFLCLIAIWFATVYWVYSDVRRRIVDPMLVGSATIGALLFPFVGALVYMIVRPPESLEDAHERYLEMQAAEARLYETGLQLCPGCDAAVEREFLRCPSCMQRLKEPCASCKRPLEKEWKVCPYCEAEVRPKEKRRPRRRRPGQPASETPAVRKAPPPG